MRLFVDPNDSNLKFIGIGLGIIYIIGDEIRLGKGLPTLISVGDKNPYGHPREEPIKILQYFGSKVYRTDKNGTVEIVSDGRSWYTTTQR